MFTRNSRNRTRSSTNQIFNFFFLKIATEISFLFFGARLLVGQVCFGVAHSDCALIQKLFALLFAFLVGEHFTFDFLFCLILMLLVFVL